MYFQDPDREFMAAAKEALEVLEDLIPTHDIFATYLRLKEIVEMRESDLNTGVVQVERSGHNMTELGFPFCVSLAGNVRGLFCDEAEAVIFALALTEGKEKPPAELLPEAFPAIVSSNPDC